MDKVAYDIGYSTMEKSAFDWRKWGRRGWNASKWIPIVGSVPSFVDAGKHLYRGNWGQAALEGGSGILNLVPGLGTAGKLGVAAGRGGAHLARAASKPGVMSAVGNAARNAYGVTRNAATPIINVARTPRNFIHGQMQQHIPGISNLMSNRFGSGASNLASRFLPGGKLIPGIGRSVRPPTGPASAHLINRSIADAATESPWDYSQRTSVYLPAINALRLAGRGELDFNPIKHPMDVMTAFMPQNATTALRDPHTGNYVPVGPPAGRQRMNAVADPTTARLIQTPLGPQGWHQNRLSLFPRFSDANKWRGFGQDINDPQGNAVGQNIPIYTDINNIRSRMPLGQIPWWDYRDPYEDNYAQSLDYLFPQTYTPQNNNPYRQ